MKRYQLFTKDECNEIIKSLVNEYNLTHYNKQNKNLTSTFNQTDVDKHFWFYHKIKNWVNSELNINCESNMFFLKYNVGDKFSMHIDRDRQSKYHYDFLWNVNVILNDEYDGGNFVINDTNYKEPAGTIYYYPSDVLHGVTEVTEGERYILMYHVRKRDITKSKDII